MKVIAKRHTDLVAWQKAMELVEEVYRVTKRFPKDELYGLTSQLRRSVVSVPSNIAEGHSRHGRREFMHGLSVAHGSLSEVETQLEIAFRLGYLANDDRATLFALTAETGRIMNGLYGSLEKHAAAS
jgi:four helix bundle protein